MQRNWEWRLRVKVINPASRRFSRERGDLQFCDHFGDIVQSLRLFLATASYLFLYFSLQAHTLINNFLDSRNGPEIMFDFKRSRRQSKCSAQTTCFDFIHWPSVWTLRYELQERVFLYCNTFQTISWSVMQKYNESPKEPDLLSAPPSLDTRGSGDHIWRWIIISLLSLSFVDSWTVGHPEWGGR